MRKQYRNIQFLKRIHVTVRQHGGPSLALVRARAASHCLYLRRLFTYAAYDCGLGDGGLDYDFLRLGYTINAAISII